MTFIKKDRDIFIWCFLVLILLNHGFVAQIVVNAWIVEELQFINNSEAYQGDASQNFICGSHADPMCVRKVKQKLAKEYPNDFVDIFFDSDAGLILLWDRGGKNVTDALKNAGFHISGDIVQTFKLREDSMRLLFLSGVFVFLSGMLLRGRN